MDRKSKVPNYIIYILTFILLLGFAVYMYYIINYSHDIVWMDQIRLVNDISAKYYNGNLTFWDLWKPYIGHRTLMYNIIFFLNTSLFGLNIKIEIIASAIILFVNATILLGKMHSSIKDTYKTDEKIYRNIALWCILGLNFVLIVFNFNKWELILLSLGITNNILLLLVIYVFLKIDKMLNKQKIKKADFFVTAILLCIILLFFSLGYTLALIVPILIIILLDIFIKKESKKIGINLLLRYLGIIIVGTLIYSYNLNASTVHNVDMAGSIYGVFRNLKDSIYFYIVGLYSGIMGGEIASQYLSDRMVFISAAIFLFIIIYSVYIFFRLKIYENTYMPLFLILYGLVFMGCVLIGRLDYGARYGMSSRYTQDLQYLALGITWIQFYSIFHAINSKIIPNKRKYKTLFAGGIISMFLMANLITSNKKEFNKGKYRKSYYMQMESVAKDISNGINTEQYPIFQSTEEETFKAIEVMKKHQLNIFKE